MKDRAKELRKLKGVGETLSRRFVEAGLDDFAKIVAAGRDGVAGIRGVNPRVVDAILAQAVEMTEQAGEERAARVEGLRQQASGLKGRLQELALGLRDRFMEEAAGPAGKRVEKELLKTVTSLERVEKKLERRTKKAAKGLAKAEKQLELLADAGLKRVGRGLKKARKSLKRVYA